MPTEGWFMYDGKWWRKSRPLGRRYQVHARKLGRYVRFYLLKHPMQWTYIKEPESG